MYAKSYSHVRSQLRYHMYADDCQIYASCDPNISGDIEATLSNMTNCIIDIKKWLSVNYLKLNDSKSEFFLLQDQNSISNILILITLHLPLVNQTSKHHHLLEILDFTLTQIYLSLLMLITSGRRYCFHIRTLWRIRRFIDKETCHHAVRALVISRLDYCNSLFTILSAKDISRLQRLQNNAARLVYAVGRRTEAAPLLLELHWLPVRQRIVFKIVLYVFKAFNNLAPPYLAEQFSVYVPARALPSSMDTTRLVVPKTNLAIGDRSFAVCAARAWNDLSPHMRTVQSVEVFKKNLKTFLF